MKYQYIRAFIVLIAGLLALIINMKMGRDVTTSLLIVLIVLLVFYFLVFFINLIGGYYEKSWNRDGKRQRSSRG